MDSQMCTQKPKKGSVLRMSELKLQLLEIGLAF